MRFWNLYKNTLEVRRHHRDFQILNLSMAKVSKKKVQGMHSLKVKLQR